MVCAELACKTSLVLFHTISLLTSSERWEVEKKLCKGRSTVKASKCRVTVHALCTQTLPNDRIGENYTHC